MKNWSDLPLVCVTGSTGFIGSHITYLLLKKGYRVRMLVRPESRVSSKEMLGDFIKFAEPGQLEIFDYDLFSPDKISEAIKNAEFIIHTASNYTLDVDNPQTQLLDVAVRGTINILNACEKNPSIKKLVFTSSVAAVTDNPNGEILTENDWNSLSTINRNPYYFAKTLAEKSVWDRVRKGNVHFKCVSINPSMTIGPSFTPRLNESNKVIKNLLSGNFPGILDLSWNIVDVRDVAFAHVMAIETQRSEGRYLCTNKTLHMIDVINIIKMKYPSQWKLPKRRFDSKISNLIIKMLSFFGKPGTGSYIRTHLGHISIFNNNKIIKEFNLAFKETDATVIDTITDLLKWGHLKFD